MSNPRKLLEVIQTGTVEELTPRLLEIYRKSALVNSDETCDDKLMKQIVFELKDEKLDDPEKYTALGVAIGKRAIDLKAILVSSDGILSMLNIQVNPRNHEEKLDQKKYGPMWTPVDNRPAAILFLLNGYLAVIGKECFGEDKLNEIENRIRIALIDYAKELKKPESPLVTADTRYLKDAAM